MKSPISRTAFQKNNSDLAFRLNDLANKRKDEGYQVINATVGSLFDDEGNLLSFSKMDKILKANVNESSRLYASIDGGPLFKENIKKWLFGNYKKGLSTKYKFGACVTPGGTGSLFLSIRNYVDENPVLIPDIGWGNYKSICKQANKTFKTYPMFKNDKFDTESLIELAKESVSEYGYCTILINDPCQNPVGYSLSEEEIEYLIKQLNLLSKKGIVNLILDVAYMEIAEEPRRFFKIISRNKAKFFTIICFSGSKLFGVYGYRLGAAIAISENQEAIEEFEDSCKSTARATWSNCNHLIINSFNYFMSKPSLQKQLLKELETYKSLLKERYLKAKELFDKEIGTNCYPYREGFFMIYPKENASLFCEELIKKDIYLLPLEDKYLRISICSFTK